VTAADRCRTGNYTKWRGERKGIVVSAAAKISQLSYTPQCLTPQILARKVESDDVDQGAMPSTTDEAASKGARAAAGAGKTLSGRRDRTGTDRSRLWRVLGRLGYREMAPGIQESGAGRQSCHGARYMAPGCAWKQRIGP